MTAEGRLTDALGIRPGQLVALVGGGGKTTAMVRIVSELGDRGISAIATTTTRVGEWELESLRIVLLDAAVDEEQRGAVGALASLSGPAFLAAGRTDDGKLTGPPADTLRRLLDSGNADVLIVEADGSRQLPLKMPAPHEPVMPAGVDLVVPVVGLDALGRKLTPGSVHRPSLFRHLAAGGSVTPSVVASVVTSERGGLKDVPERAGVVPLLNKLTEGLWPGALETARLILDKSDERISRVVAADIKDGRFRVVRSGRC